jgi:putative heme-binding domain-containing protein
VLADGPAGDAARGRQVFLNTCGKCHAVRGEGARLGPDLTGFARGHVDYLIANTIDPNAVIRPEYATFVVKTRAGEVLNGTMIDTGDVVTVDDGQTRTAVPRDQVLSAEPSPVSRMPEKLLDGMKPQEVRDLFAFLTS